MKVNFQHTLIHKDDRLIYDELISTCISNGQSQTEYRIIHSSGEVRFIRSRCRSVTGGIIGISVDITQEIISQSTSLEWESYFNLSAEFLCVSSLAGYFIKINPAFINCLGYPLAELLSQPFMNFVHPEDVARTLKEMEKLGRGVTTLSFENRYRCKDGTYKLICWKSAPSVSEGKLYCTARDVTREKEIQLSLNRTNNLLEATQSTARVGGWEIDLETQELFWTRETYVIHELTPDSYKPSIETAIQFYAPEHVPLITQAVEKAIKNGQPFDLELQIITSTGSRVWVRSKGVVTYDSNQKPVILTGIFQDITELKNIAEEKLKQTQLLIASAKMSSLGEMAASIAHEINNPLAVIASSTHILKEKVDTADFKPEELRDHVNDIQKTVNDIIEIISSLRLFSSGASPERLEKGSVRDVIQNTILICKEKFRLNDVDFSFDYETSQDYLSIINPITLSQVVLNLLNNSFDAVLGYKDKWIKVYLRKSDSHILINFVDSGIGIGKEFSARILEPFFTTKEVGKGTGLGLPISKGIIEYHNGSLVYDEGAAHTTFKIQLPRVD